MINVVQRGAVQDQRGTRTGQHGGAMEADGMGCGFEGQGGLSAAPAQLFGDGDAPIQRQVIRYRSQANDQVGDDALEAADRVANKIDQRVKQARTQALNWPDLENERGHLKRWHKVAGEYCANPDGIQDFVHSSFGYAVETLACRELNHEEEGLTVSLQVNAGATRPDIVLSIPGDGPEVAWIDVTATQSAGHIFNKGGGGWNTKPYVAEVLYPSLDKAEILTGMENPVVREIGVFKHQQQRVREDERLQYADLMREEVGKFQKENGYYDTTGNQQKKMKKTKDFLKNSLGVSFGQYSTIELKGFIKELGFDPGHFGMKANKTPLLKKGKKFSTKDRYTDHTNKKTQPMINEKMQGLYEGQMQQPSRHLSNYSYRSDVHSYLNSNRDFNEDNTYQYIAAKCSAEILPQLRSATFRLRDLIWQGYPGQTMFTQIQSHIESFRASGTVEALQDWANHAAGMLDWTMKFLEEVVPQDYKMPHFEVLSYQNPQQQPEAGYEEDLFPEEEFYRGGSDQMDCD